MSALSTAEMLALDDVVSRAVRKRPGESIADAARRIMQAPHGDRAWRVAREVLLGRGEPWPVPPAPTHGRRSAMNERPILFSGPMVRAILAGRKTVTRRIVDPKRRRVRLARTVSPDFGGISRCPDAFPGVYDTWMNDHGAVAVVLGEHTLGVKPDEFSWVSPYGEPGDRLWVRETFATDVPGCDRGISYRADHRDPRGDGPAHPMKWKPSIFMRRHESRLLLDVVDVRVERLQEIDGADILAEGVVARGHDDAVLGRCPVSAFDGKLYPDLKSLWASGWDAINGDRAPWSSNPWVWRVEFRRLEHDRAANERRPPPPATMGGTP